MSITEKNYKKLALQVKLNGFAFCVFDTLQHTIWSCKEIDFSTFQKEASVENYFSKALLEYPELSKTYDEIIVLHDNNLNTFVPKPLFDENFLGSYLQYNTKVFESDFFTFDEVSNYDINNVYIPYININNFLIDTFGTFDYKHCTTILVSKILDLSKNDDEKQVFVHFSYDKFEIIVVQNQRLLLFNSFEYKTEIDFIYYLLFTVEQLNLNPEKFSLQLLGAVSEESEFFKIAYKYIRNVSLLDVSILKKSNDFTTAQNLKHFILFQS